MTPEEEGKLAAQEGKRWDANPYNMETEWENWVDWVCAHGAEENRIFLEAEGMEN